MIFRKESVFTYFSLCHVNKQIHLLVFISEGICQTIWVHALRPARNEPSETNLQLISAFGFKKLSMLVHYLWKITFGPLSVRPTDFTSLGYQTSLVRHHGNSFATCKWRRRPLLNDVNSRDYTATSRRKKMLPQFQLSLNSTEFLSLRFIRQALIATSICLWAMRLAVISLYSHSSNYIVFEEHLLWDALITIW